jgi:hypothetical protein
MRLSLGLRTLDVAEWLDVDEHYSDDLTEKRRLLRERPGDVVAHLPAGRDAAQETLEVVRGWMSEHHPDLVQPSPIPGLHPVDAAGRLVQEDLCVMTQESGVWRLTAASVCFPSRWSLREKIGTTLGQIHDPVPGYHDAIGSIVDSSLDRLDVSRPLWRRNWSILDDPALFQPAPSPSLRAQPAALSALTLRVERQTLRRLPATGAVLFTIRTYRRGLDQVVCEPSAARDLAASLRTCSPELAAYKGWTTMLEWLVDTLDAVTVAETQPG